MSALHILWGGDEDRSELNFRFQKQFVQVAATLGHLGPLSDRRFDHTSLLLILPEVSVKHSASCKSPESKQEIKKISLCRLSFLPLINNYLHLCYKCWTSQEVSLRVPARCDRLLLFNNAWWCLLIQLQATAVDMTHMLLVDKWPWRMKVAMYILHDDIKGLICSS